MLGRKLSCSILMPMRSKKYSSVSVGLKSEELFLNLKGKKPTLTFTLMEEKKEHAEEKKKMQEYRWYHCLLGWLHGCCMKFHSGMLPFRKQCNKKENVPFPFHPNQSRRAVLSIALIFVFNSSFYFPSGLYYHTPKALGGIHLEQSKQIYKSVGLGPTSLFPFCAA